MSDYIVVPAGAIKLPEVKPLSAKKLRKLYPNMETMLESLATPAPERKARTEVSKVSNNGWTNRQTGTVDWSKQDQRFDMQSAGGRTKKGDGKK